MRGRGEGRRRRCIQLNSATRPLARGRTLTPLAPACARHGIMIHNRPEFTQPRVKTHWELGVARGSECSARPENGCAVRASSKNHEVIYTPATRLAACLRSHACFRPHCTTNPLGAANAAVCDRPVRDSANNCAIVVLVVTPSSPRARAQEGSGGFRRAVISRAARRDAEFFRDHRPSDTFRDTKRTTSTRIKVVLSRWTMPGRAETAEASDS